MKTLVVAPHPDDEVLGVGGTIFKRKEAGVQVAWLIVTEISTSKGWDINKVQVRKKEIDEIAKIYNFDKVYNLKIPTTLLDTIPVADLVSKIRECLNDFKPNEIFIPHNSDIHSDHRVVFNSMLAFTKWFRYPFIKKILSYETLSETNFSFGMKNKFNPNVYINISKYIEKKIESMSIYESEIEDFPFPRSKDAIYSLAKLRGSESGFFAAEGFELILDKIES